MRKPSQSDGPITVSIVGPGNLGTALASVLPPAGYAVKLLVSRGTNAKAISRETKKLARSLKARIVELGKSPLETDVVWITVPDGAIASTARTLARSQEWRGAIVFHSSGALTSDELAPLRKKGASAASVHPMMTFVRGSDPEMAGVAFSVEGDAKAVRVARRMVADMGGTAYSIQKRNKVLYHAFGSFASPLVIALMAALEEVAEAAGIRKQDVKPMMVPLLGKTLHNYLNGDGASAFSGPLVRGDVATIRKHLQELKAVPDAREVYLALARTALNRLPVKNRNELGRVLKKKN